MTFEFSMLNTIDDLRYLISDLSDLYPENTIYYLDFHSKEQYTSGKFACYNSEMILEEVNNHNYKNETTKIDFEEIRKKAKKIGKM